MFLTLNLLNPFGQKGRRANVKKKARSEVTFLGVSTSMYEENQRRNGERDDDGNLRIDDILSMQPELGPSIPEGGYGWVILLASVLVQGLIPSLASAFGVYLMFSRLEHTTPKYPKLWDDQLLYVPWLFATFWTFADPWSRILIKNSNWPRLVGLAGVCLTCASLCFVWLGVMNGAVKLPLFAIAGIFSGIGTAILISQTEILLAQYFNVKLASVNNILQASVALGFVLSPYVIGNNVIKYGLAHVLIWHQAILLQGILICAAFKKPPYMKSKRKTYQHIMATADDEEDIFTRNSRELQIKRTNSTETQVTVEVQTHHNNNNVDEAGSSSRELQRDKKDWVKFEEDDVERSASRQPNDGDLERIEKFEDNFAVEAPRPLFTDLQVNNNTTYSYDLVETPAHGNGGIEISNNSGPSVFMPVVREGRRSGNLLRQSADFFRQPTFYKSLLMVITTRFSFFLFFTLFPSYLYVRVERLRVHHATFLVGSLAISGLLFTSVAIWINVYTKKRPLFLCIFCWLGSAGYFMLSDTSDEALLLVGGTTIILSINALQFVGAPLLGLTIRGETTEMHKTLSVMSGLAFFLFPLINFSYIDCFRLVSTLHFVTGAIWLLNYIYKKTRRHPGTT